MAEAYRQDIERKVRPYGIDWSQDIKDQIVEAGLARAEARLRAGKYRAEENFVEVTVPISIKIRFPINSDLKTLAADAGVQCSCTWKPYPEGGGVCICLGPGAGDPNCDCPAQTLPPVA
jgi:hypothetical protein